MRTRSLFYKIYFSAIAIFIAALIIFLFVFGEPPDQRSRFLLGKDDNGKKRILLLETTLEEIRESLGDSGKNDAFFGRVDCLLTEMEELTENFKRM